jgi:hypothetical protein
VEKKAEKKADILVNRIVEDIPIWVPQKADEEEDDEAQLDMLPAEKEWHREALISTKSASTPELLTPLSVRFFSYSSCPASWAWCQKRSGTEGRCPTRLSSGPTSNTFSRQVKQPHAFLSPCSSFWLLPLLRPEDLCAGHVRDGPPPLLGHCRCAVRKTYVLDIFEMAYCDIFPNFHGPCRCAVRKI